MKLLHILFVMIVISALTVDGMCCFTACFISSFHISNHAPHFLEFCHLTGIDCAHWQQT